MEEVQNTKPNKSTYLCLVGPDGISVEVDLVTFREKGQQTKYMSISFVDTTQNPPATLAAQSFDQESFSSIKKFFEQLDWNS